MKIGSISTDILSKDQTTIQNSVCTNKNQIPNMMDDSGNVRAICVAYTSFIILAI